MAPNLRLTSASRGMRLEGRRELTWFESLGSGMPLEELQQAQGFLGPVYYIAFKVLGGGGRRRSVMKVGEDDMQQQRTI